MKQKNLIRLPQAFPRLAFRLRPGQGRSVIGGYLILWRAFWLIMLAVGPWLSVFLITSCSTTSPAGALSFPEIEGATFVGNKACQDCHANYTRAFASSPHSRLRMVNAEVPGGIGCESCHGPGSLHVKSGGGRGKFIVNPRKETQACFNCHLEQQAEFKLPQHHPVTEGRMSCIQCHDPHGLDLFKPKGGLSLSRGNDTCAACHREQTRLVVYEHEALREGCAVCHQAHGSTNDKMLIQRDNNLCLKCHAQVHATTGDIYIGETPHTAFLNRGSCWTSGCHAAVHGSNIDRKLRY